MVYIIAAELAWHHLNCVNANVLWEGLKVEAISQRQCHVQLFFLSSDSSIEYSKLSDHPDFKGNSCLPLPSLIIPAFSRTFIEPILATAQ
ncbi:MAG: hypothetical protein ACI83L_002411, partial [Cryomorphaceae bacterium]